MKVSVITVAFNAQNTIGDTLKSVAAQTGVDVEHILIDGASKDGTMAVVEDYRHRLALCVSEPDRGIYDAMNKGIGLATGDIVGFINADDFYASPNALRDVALAFADSAIDACYGDLCYVAQNDSRSVVRYWRSSVFRPGSFADGWCPPHPTFFVRREIFQRHGTFDLSYKIAADVELMMRFLESAKIRSAYIPRVLVTMRMGGVTNRSYANILNQNREILRALKHHKLPASIWRLLAKKVLSRGLQFVQRPPENSL